MPLAVIKSSLTLPSFAKLNRSLRILGRRLDGYHEIDTILQTISLHDELTFTWRDDKQIALCCDNPNIPIDRGNLIVQAGLLLRDTAAVDFGANIELTKRIPAQGGLGGASSNAAVSLLALNYLWDLGLDLDSLRSLGARLGSDVPFFFLGGLVRARGTGAEVSPLPDEQKIALVVITPNAKVSTASAYDAVKSPSLTTEGSVSILSSSFAGPNSSNSDSWALNNDFEGVIFEIEPEIKRAKSALLEAGAQGGLLTGSGSSVFGIFENEDARERALANLKSEAGWQVFSCETISRGEYFERLSWSGFPLLRSLNFQTDTGA